jgi:hypothetical protein
MSVDYSSVLADLNDRIEKLTIARDAIREIVSTTISGVPAFATVTGHAGTIRRGSAKTKKARTGTVASIAHELIRTHGGPMKVREIVQSLQGMGKFKTNDARSNYGTVFGTLNDDKERFVKTGEGEFDIKGRDQLALTRIGAPGPD